MYEIGDYLVYLKDVCKIVDIKEKFLKNEDYYTLIPVNDNSLKLNVPINNKDIRNLITLSEVNQLIDNILFIEPIYIDDKLLEQEYKKLINSKNHSDLIKIIKTTYLRNKNRIDNKKKVSDKDKTYFELAEKYLYTELGIVLNKSFEETKEYIIKKVLEGKNE